MDPAEGIAVCVRGNVEEGVAVDWRVGVVRGHFDLPHSLLPLPT